MKSTTKLITTLVVGYLTVAAFALTGYMKLFQETYQVPKDSVIGKAKCMVCHTDQTGKKLNLYGTDIKKAGDGKKLTAEMLKSIQQIDSDKDGFDNITEIRADRLPGDPKSKPAN